MTRATDHSPPRLLYVANEDDNVVTVVDVASAKVVAEIPTGVEPEGIAVSPDGATIVNTSETTSMAHFIDAAQRRIVANVLVGSRPPSAHRRTVSSLNVPPPP